jgi:DNA polymerase
MDIWVIDLETYFDPRTYTLKKMTTEEYVRDARFEALTLSVIDPEGNRHSYGQDEIKPFLASVDWSKCVILCHHAHFDGLILARYGVCPLLWLDTLGMSRALFGLNEKHSLEAMAQRFGLPSKTVPYHLFEGRHWHELSPDVRDELMRGSERDCWLTWRAFQIMYPLFPFAELIMIDLTVRMFIEGKLEGDAQGFYEIERQEIEKKRFLLDELGVDAEALRSSSKLVELLEKEGVEVEYKEGKQGPIPCVAKTDAFMKGLQDHENERVQAIAEARLGVQSSIRETRARRLAEMSERGPLCVYLNYCGAHTGRWAGKDKLNFQNLPKVGGIRECIKAPPGHVLIIVDSAQIECRLLNSIAGQESVVSAFRSGRDLYCELASVIFNRPITKEDKQERHLGKVTELGCGYGMGPPRFHNAARTGGANINMELAITAVQTYRETHPCVKNLWQAGDKHLEYLAEGTPFDEPIKWGPCKIQHKKLILPNGLPIHYELQRGEDAEGRLIWLRKTRRGFSKIWGGHLVENMIQGVARVALSHAVRLAFDTSLGLLRPMLLAHDEAVYVVPTDLADICRQIVEEAFSSPLPFWPDCPIKCEVIVSDCYSKSQGPHKLAVPPPLVAVNDPMFQGQMVT